MFYLLYMILLLIETGAVYFLCSWLNPSVSIFTNFEFENILEKALSNMPTVAGKISDLFFDMKVGLTPDLANPNQTLFSEIVYTCILSTFVCVNMWLLTGFMKKRILNSGIIWWVNKLIIFVEGFCTIFFSVLSADMIVYVLPKWSNTVAGSIGCFVLCIGLIFGSSYLIRLLTHEKTSLIDVIGGMIVDFIVMALTVLCVICASTVATGQLSGTMEAIYAVILIVCIMTITIVSSVRLSRSGSGNK